MNNYLFWQPGNITGEIKAYSSFSATQKILKSENVFWVSGNIHNTGALYVNNSNKTCLIWLNNPKDI